VHLQKTTNAAKTIQAKEAFERYARSHHVTVRHYHADNGRFADNKFREAVAKQGQTLSFCGVNAHFQNGVAERRIRELQDHARTMLIHANKRWPTAIDTHLWPYAIRTANDVLNSAPDLKREFAPIEAFSQTRITTNPKHFCPFGCPVYVLNNALQAGKKINKWKERARVGIYLGPSPQHARTVALVLSLKTGLASPQFHVRIDPTFQTMRHSFADGMPISRWQDKCHCTEKQDQHGSYTSEGGKPNATSSEETSPAETELTSDTMDEQDPEIPDEATLHPQSDSLTHAPAATEGGLTPPDPFTHAPTAATEGGPMPPDAMSEQALRRSMRQ
jgi:hypothetical protein